MSVALIIGVILVIPVLVLVAKFIFNSRSEGDIISKHVDSPESKSIFIKKYPESNLANYKSVFFLTGLVLALLLVITAFTYTPKKERSAMLGELYVPEDIEIEPPATKRPPPPPPPPPPPKIEVVEDEEIIEEEPEIEMEEIEEETMIEELPEVEEEQVDEEKIFDIVEDMPVFPGGETALIKYLSSIPYPQIAKENDIEGSVYVRFVVDKTGNVTNVEVARGADKILNEAAVAHIKRMPKWTPGKQRGKAVKVQFIVPIKFRLD